MVFQGLWRLLLGSYVLLFNLITVKLQFNFWFKILFRSFEIIKVLEYLGIVGIDIWEKQTVKHHQATANVQAKQNEIQMNHDIIRINITTS